MKTFTEMFAESDGKMTEEILREFGEFGWATAYQYKNELNRLEAELVEAKARIQELEDKIFDLECEWKEHECSQ